MRMFKMLLAAARGLLLAAVLASLAYGAASVFLLSAINNALRTLPEGRGRGVALFAAMALLMVLAQTTSSVLFMRLCQRTQANLRWYIFQRATSAPYRRVEQVVERRACRRCGDGAGRGRRPNRTTSRRRSTLKTWPA
ncbi:hypothetical protein ACFWP0_12265 [Achromobacter sp. NPDC058515]|uniref:hypothetical protein n=1 Tax=Achromobacter sp. NPDC058515 TaxID=3346533 RepID=UPI003669154A